MLAAVRPALVGQGFAVEASKAKTDKVIRPVLFGDQGVPRLTYEVDGYHDGHGIVLEVEAGRGAVNNAAHATSRASLIVGARFLLLAMMQHYQSGKATWRSYEAKPEQFDAIYASERLLLPFEGVVVLGY